MPEQREIAQPGPLIGPDGELAQAGWARQSLQDCNAEFRFHPIQERVARTPLAIIDSEVHQRIEGMKTRREPLFLAFAPSCLRGF